MEITEFSIGVNDFPNICRLCLNFGEFKPFFENNIPVSRKTCIDTLKIIAEIEVKDGDNLPKNICNTCIKQLTNIEKFINICKCSNSFLKSVLTAVEDKESPLLESDNLQSNGENEDSFDEIDDTVLSERKVKVKLKLTNSVKKENIKKKSESNFRIKKRQSNIQKTKKRIEECECNVCGKKFTRHGGLKRHSKIHLGIKPYKCEICDKTFVEKATLNRHCLIHTGEKPFECNLCGKLTTRKDQILEHINKHHPNAINCDFVVTEHKINKVDAKNTQICSVNENDAIEDKLQIDESKNLIDLNFEITEDATSDIGKVRSFKTKKRIEICLCNLCGKVFRRKGYLKNHMAIHAKIKPFECKICGKGFTQRHALTRHNLVHTKERPFQCNLCGKTFTRKEILMDHLKNHEEGNKPYLCFHCGKCFSNKDYLSKHLKYYLPGKGKKKINTEEKKCICPQCGKQLHSVSYLKTHLLTHTGEKPYECNICGNRFTVLRSLNHHLNIHKGVKPYQCTQCEKAFRTSGSLRKHLLLHTGERPFKCTSCEKGFIRRSHLKRHLRIH